LPRADYWVSKGARPSATVASIILKARKKAAADAEKTAAS
jgi:ribosomal protein S16